MTATKAPVKRPKTLSAQDIDWANLGFDYVQTKSHIRYTWTEETGWDEGYLVTDDVVSLHIAATVLHYGQSAFEGLKAFRMKDGKVRIFRPELNARRLIDSCKATSMVAPPEDLFLTAVRRVVEDNIDYVPPYGSNGSMYIRPFVVGAGPQIGLSPAGKYYFMVFVNPVGDYYKGGFGSPARGIIKYGFDRAAPNGTGNVKLGGNYAPALGPTSEVKKRGYSIMLFLDPKRNKYVDEFATSNFAALTAPDPATGLRTYATPKSKSILPSVTNRSLMELAQRHFGWNIETRRIKWEEVLEGKFAEFAACGTAVIITPVGVIEREVPQFEKRAEDEDSDAEDEKEPTGFEMEVVKVSKEGMEFQGFRQLYDAYRALQYGDLDGWEDYGWLWPAEGL
ncbi:hypothetical protein HK102_000417 [Quaeritorhiza haematococci]|nr:hypothetical protein HK102_000417 [Quaeritorhiza haematococci]